VLERLRQKLNDKAATIASVGLGYVGLRFALSYVGAGYKVVGIDADPKRLGVIMEGKCALSIILMRPFKQRYSKVLSELAFCQKRMKQVRLFCA